MNMVKEAISRESSDSSRKASNEVSDQFPTGLRVLVVDDDRICLRVTEYMLRNCLYEVTTCTQAVVALSMLRERKSGFDLVISDVHMPEMDGFMLLEHIGLEMNLPVIMMSADEDKEAVMKGITHGACDYLIKPVRMEAIKNIWQHVIRKKANELKELEQSGSVEDSDRHRKTSEDGDYTSSTNEASCRNFKKRRDDEDEVEEKKDTSTLKKQRVVWTVELHQQFVAAVRHLGLEKAVPKKILELMRVPGITRENVASHLQKYRLYLRRVKEASQHQTGLSTPFMDPTEANFEPMPSVDLQTLGVSGEFAPQSLDTLQAGLVRSTANSGMGMPLVDPRNIFSAEASKVNVGEGKRLLNNNNKQVNLHHRLPTTLEPNQLPYLHQPILSLGNMGLQVSEGASGFINLPTASLGTFSLAHADTLRGNQSGSQMTQMALPRFRTQFFYEIPGGHFSGFPLSIGQQIFTNEMTDPILGSNGTVGNGRGAACNHPVTRASSVFDLSMNHDMELPGNILPLGITAEISCLQPTGLVQDVRGSEVKGLRSFTPCYDIANELHQSKNQGWELLPNASLTFESCRHANPIQCHINPSPSVLGHQGFMPSQKNEQNGNSPLRGENQQGNLESITQSYYNLSVDNSFRIKGESMTDLSCDSILLTKQFDQDDLMSALFKQEQEWVELIENEFNLDGYPMDNIPM